MRRFVMLIAFAFVLSVQGFAAGLQPPAQPAKYIPPVKGTATIEVIQPPSRRVGKEMVTMIKVRTTSKGSIALLKAEEYWYDQTGKPVTSAQYAHKKAPIRPGEIIEFTLRSPVHSGTDPKRNQVMFRHANGEAKATQVKAFK